MAKKDRDRKRKKKREREGDRGEKEKDREEEGETRAERKSVCVLILGHKLNSGNSPSNPLDPYWHNYKHTYTHTLDDLFDLQDDLVGQSHKSKMFFEILVEQFITYTLL